MANGESSPTERRSTPPTRAKKLVFSAILIAIGLAIALGLAELVLRVFPIPGVERNLTVYDDLAGYHLYPNATRVYRNRDGVVRRKVNSLGYLDREHDSASGAELKIGFFGDSYTEARQVPLEQTFFRLIEHDLAPHVETLAFGQSGFSTLQSYLTSTSWIDRFDIDLVVYVFVENDPGDQLKQIQPRPAPYPVLTESGLGIDNSFRDAIAAQRSWLHRAGDFLTSHSLVFAVVSQRMRLLLTYGPKLSVTDADRSMGAGGEEDGTAQHLPNENDPPSLWPTDLKNEAIELTEATILAWRDYVEQRGKDFAVLYIPRGSELQKPTAQQDSWKPWLEPFLLRANIPLIDPTPELAAMESAGRQVFYDHFTPFGHVATANAFKAWLEQSYGGR
jgi:hypothetical protein